MMCSTNRGRVVLIGAAVGVLLAGCGNLLGLVDPADSTEGGASGDASAADSAASESGAATDGSSPDDGGGAKDASALSDADAGSACIGVDASGDDPLNCGECGRSCNGDPCQAGKCAPINLVTGCGAPLRILADDTNIYWANFAGSGNGQSVRQANKDGTGEIVIISVNYAWGLAQSGSTILTTALFDNARVIGKGTANVAGSGIAYNAGGSWGFGIAADVDNVYWTGADGVIRSNAIAAPGTPSVIASGETTYPTGDNPNLQDMAVDGTWAYWVDTAGGKIRKAGKTGDGGASTVATANAPSAVVVDGSFIYWTAQAGNYIGRAPVGGGAATELVKNTTAPLRLKVDATHVYWINATELWRARLDGTGVLKLGDGFYDLKDLALDATNVYLTDRGGGGTDGGDPSFAGRVVRVAK